MDGAKKEKHPAGKPFVDLPCTARSNDKSIDSLVTFLVEASFSALL